MHDLSHLRGLYSPEFEHDNCGLGLIAKLDNKPSKKLIELAIESLCRLSHRGGLAADGVTGDGCGLLIKKPDAFFRRIAKESFAADLSAIYAVGMIFLSRDKNLRAFEQQSIEQELNKHSLSLIGWREVPVDEGVLGEQARASEPVIKQLFIGAKEAMQEDEFNRHLFSVRRFVEMGMANAKEEHPQFYMASLHSRTIIYKGLIFPRDLPRFYLDMVEQDFASSMCSYHQRFSTNTLPSWQLAQPFRYLAHNGELNTIRGNRNWALSRTSLFENEFVPEITEMTPIVSQQGSDSNTLDNMLEVLVMGGLSLIKALRLLIPPAWQNDKNLPSQDKNFFDFHSHHMEPWDGPAGIMLHDGDFAVCSLDRNGLRPSRYVVTKDGYVSFASEVGVLDSQAENILEKGRLQPGQLMAIDLHQSKILHSDEIIHTLAQENDYTQWLKDSRQKIITDTEEISPQSLGFDDDSVHHQQKYFNVSFEERDQILRVLAEEGQEATGSMGDDVPLPPFSQQARSLYDYFRQVFAQVTNPPIDSLRETIVMSLQTILGPEPNIFTADKKITQRLDIDSPIISPAQMQQVSAQKVFPITTKSLHYPSGTSLIEAIEKLCQECETAVREGIVILHLSDANIKENHLSIHSLMAVGAVHHHLIKQRLRHKANLVIETATARDPHHFAVLLGYGATLIYPYLSYLTLAEMMKVKELSAERSLSEYCANYLKGINKGLLKIFSKIGISTVSSYRGAQLFEIVGLADEVVDKCFTGSVSRIGGVSYQQLEADQEYWAKLAFNPRKTISQGGLLKYVHGGEEHAYNPQVVDILRTALQQGNQAMYDKFADLVNNRTPIMLRDYFQLTSNKKAISIDKVEPVEELFKRFDGAGISMGALSPEAHEAIAEAMNTLGARSNSGEGGEDQKRFGTIKNSKIKQVASGRFGVTTEYLMNAEVVQIKVAQGAKPGEGGQLPGHKVDQYIGKLRYSTPGVTLISPPPHHDIYSIEDLAQLIYDLKQVNPSLLVSVKLVSSAGVGTIAAGVAKAYADLITISGYDGGTGASPLTSVKYAGGPFEIGLSETRQVLRANDLRGQIRLQTDGGLKTGLDVIKAAILGAESFGFGTAPMIALGCKYLRICHLNICPVGVATQKDKLRKEHFTGMPQMVINYFQFVAQEVRQILAQLGVQSLQDIIGKTEYLKTIDNLPKRQIGLNLQALLSNEGISKDKPQYCQQERNRPWDKGEKAEQMLQTVLPAIEAKSGGVFNFEIENTDRSIGARISGEIAKRYGNDGMEAKPLIIHLSGVAGQSFGVWNAGGLHLYLQGDANDYTGKGMSGGKLVLVPPKNSDFDAQKTPIMGNTCLYGATGGKLYADGLAGERFAVRNSGTNAVILGMGEHGCEYMTGGIVVSLGKVGSNFAAGMSGGCAFIYDIENNLANYLNHEMVELFNLNHSDYGQQIALLNQQIKDFVKHTQSKCGQKILDNFDNEITNFKFIKPKAMAIEMLMQAVS
jgi:glutamate synthase (NADPH/NADH) large chain